MNSSSSRQNSERYRWHASDQGPWRRHRQVLVAIPVEGLAVGDPGLGLLPRAEGKQESEGDDQERPVEDVGPERRPAVADRRSAVVLLPGDSSATHDLANFRLTDGGR